MVLQYFCTDAVRPWVTAKRILPGKQAHLHPKNNSTTPTKCEVNKALYIVVVSKLPKNPLRRLLSYRGRHEESLSSSAFQTQLTLAHLISILHLYSSHFFICEYFPNEYSLLCLPKGCCNSYHDVVHYTWPVCLDQFGLRERSGWGASHCDNNSTSTSAVSKQYLLATYVAVSLCQSY